MRTILRASCLAILMEAFCCAALSQVAFPVERPTFQAGERWKFVTLDGISKLPIEWRSEAVIATGPDASVVEVDSSTGAQPNLTYDGELNLLTDLKGKTEREGKFSFPLELGKSWDARWAWINPRGREGRMEMRYKVTGVERLKVGAGEFDAVVIAGDGRWYNTTSGASGIALEKIWYAPATKRVIRRTWVTRYAGGQPDQNFVNELSELSLAK